MILIIKIVYCNIYHFAEKKNHYRINKQEKPSQFHQFKK